MDCRQCNRFLQAYLDGDLDFVLIEDGLWHHVRHTLQEAFVARDQRNRPSYWVDEIIAAFHTSIGFHLSDEAATDSGSISTVFKRDPESPGTVEQYLAIISELASMKRIERRLFGEKLIEKLAKAATTGRSYGLLDRKDGSGFLILCSSADRCNRLEELGRFSTMAYVSRDLEKIVGIATEPEGAEERSFDGLIIEGAEFDDQETIREEARQFFKPLEDLHLHEWDD